MVSLKIAFIGGVEFSYEILKHLLENNFQVSVIFSYDEKKKSIFSDFKSMDDLSKKYNIKNIKVKNINDDKNIEILNQIKPDLILVMGWSQLLKDNLLKIPKIGVIGSHPTELPKYRGRAPIPWTIIKKLKESAETFFWITEGTDDGDILDQSKFTIDDDDDATSLYWKVIKLAKNMIVKNLNNIKNGKIIRLKQNDEDFIEYWPKRSHDDGKILWSNTSKTIHDLIRASTKPYPGAFTFFNGKKLTIWNANILNEKSSGNGVIMNVNNKIVKIGTRDSVIVPTKISVDGESILPYLFFSKRDEGVILDS